MGLLNRTAVTLQDDLSDDAADIPPGRTSRCSSSCATPRSVAGSLAC